MNEVFLAAFALQWVAIAALALMMVGLLRQVGMLHERLGPVGALTLSGGAKVGEIAPAFELPRGQRAGRLAEHPYGPGGTR